MQQSLAFPELGEAPARPVPGPMRRFQRAVTIDIAFVHHGRRRCERCGMRRQAYGIEFGPWATPPLCAACLGIRGNP